jgi:signal transduction histidine kinase
VTIDHKAFPVLYVDDDAANLTAFSYCFDEEFDVITAASAEAGLAIMGQREVAVLVTDQRMPHMTGAQLCHQAKQTHPDTVRVVVSAYADITAAVESINAGEVHRYILKPWREQDMGAMLRACVESYSLGKLVKTMQLRLLDSQQQAGAHLMLNRMLHELANPAQALIGFSQLLHDQIRVLARALEPVAASAAPVLEDIIQVTGELLECTNALANRLNHFRDGGLPHPPPPRGIDLARATLSAITIVRGAVQKRARLNLTTDSALPLVAIDATQASQIIVNLIVNAHEALTAANVERNRIDVSLEAGDRHAVLQVKDNGHGIPPDKLPLIFDTYFTTKGGGPGRGLGLAIVRDIVDGAGGTVEVQSTPGEGTTFRVLLPYSAGGGAG